MGAFGSCLGIGRPNHANSNAKQYNASSQNVNSSHFLPSSSAGRQNFRPSGSDTRHAYLPNGKQTAGNQFGKILRQNSNLSSSNQQSKFAQSPTVHQNVPKLVDIDSASNFQSSPDQSETAMEFTRRIRMAKPEEINILIACYDYQGGNPDDLEFKRGEHLETCESLMKTDWWLAKSMTTRKCGYVPSNYVKVLKSHEGEAWYFPKIGRAVAETALKSPGNADGSFIIRDSDTAQQQFSLSVRHEDEVKHYRIKRFETGGFYIARKTVFSTIQDLVAHYSIKADGLCINLRQPCMNSLQGPVTLGLSHDTCDRWEIDRNDVVLGKELGRGQFGQVFEGIFRGTIPVAIKTLRKGTMDPQDFLAEAQIMKNMKDNHLVQLHAVCTKQEPVYIVTELMPKGALINYLQTNEGKNLRLCDYINMAHQVASGMKYLEREKYVHRDLAARNILVGDDNVCKIADFGLARIIKETEYEARAGARFPIKWTAPEAANFSKFTIKSDVWSFGIVLYEIITKGGTPYPDMSNAEVLSQIDRGYRMPQPPGCQAKYYAIMLECWQKEPLRRPTFETLSWKLKDYFVNDEQQYRDISQFMDSAPGRHCN